MKVSMDFGIWFWLIVIVGIFVLVLVSGLLMGFLTFLIKIGVAISQARKPPHVDAGDYRLDQGRDVRFEDDERRPTTDHRR